MAALDGIKVLELARVPPAEMPGMIMADMGADVLKIETPEPDRASDELSIRRTIHAFVNRNKRSMTLNMKGPEGQAIFRKLAAGADVIVEGFRPGVMDRLGAGYEALKALNPRIIYCSLSGFGQDGPYKNYPAHDMNYLSLAGVLPAARSRSSRSISSRTTPAPACTARSASCWRYLPASGPGAAST
jgi:crotonobetainyl-CoA:carnitine CoA-transferase CaiB-like acyl-CoA transferase